jgi:predicted amidohydrolase YtcJ
VNDGQSNASAWSEWAFAPMRFDGQTKHVMASALREVFHHNRAAFPYVDMLDEREDPEWIAFVRQLGNMKASRRRRATRVSRWPTKIGDDYFDAACAAMYALITRGLADAPTTIQQRRVSREDLLALPGAWRARGMTNRNRRDE